MSSIERVTSIEKSRNKDERKRKKAAKKAAKKAREETKRLEAQKLRDRRWKAEEMILEQERIKALNELELNIDSHLMHKSVKSTYGQIANASKVEYVVAKNPDTFEHSHLYVADLHDLTELTLKEIRYVWLNRLNLCGSVEVAAEALAIMEVDLGLVESYQGWQTYVSRPELKELKDKFDVGKREDLASQEITSDLNQKYFSLPSKIADIEDKTHEEIKALWDGRPNSFSSIEVACEILARLRFDGGIDSYKKHWKTYIHHPEIKLIEYEYPEHIDSQEHLNQTENFSFNKLEQNNIKHDITVDKRNSVTRSQKERKGQQAFRQLIMQAYKGKCNVTGCLETSLLEAAHISPYMGEHSNLLKNGLCLRVDIHRLFDKFLISINPESYKLVVSTKIQDEDYLFFNNKRIFTEGVKPSSALLEQHYITFLKIEKSTQR